jgi:hypothetical protein
MWDVGSVLPFAAAAASRDASSPAPVRGHLGSTMTTSATPSIFMLAMSAPSTCPRDGAAQLHDRGRRAVASRTSLGHEPLQREDRGSRASSRDEERVREGGIDIDIVGVRLGTIMGPRRRRRVAEHRAEALGRPVLEPTLRALQHPRREHGVPFAHVCPAPSSDDDG